MTATQSDLAGLSRFIFRAPNWYTSVVTALLVAAMTGVAAFESGTAATSWRGLLFVGQDAWEGVFFVGLPTVAASLGTAGVDRFLGGQLTPNRSSLLALVCELLIVVLLTGAGIVSALTALRQTFVFDVLVVALASVFALRLLVVMAVSRSSLVVAAVPASVQTVTAAALLFVYSGTMRLLTDGGSLVNAYLVPYLDRQAEAPPELAGLTADHFLLLGALCVVYALAVWTFLVVIDRPWRNSLGVSMLDFLQGFIGHVAEGTRELEDFFEQLGEDAVVPVTVLVFEDADGAEKARFVLPMIHPGPMGEIGGGNLPERVAEVADGLAFPPHATAGHDFNLVTEREVDTVIDAVERAAERVDADGGATTPVTAEAGEATVLGQAFGDDALLVNTFAPAFADDVAYAVGLSARAEAETEGLDDVMFVDAHNSNDGLNGPDLGHVTPGSERSFDMMRAASDAGAELADAERDPLAVGTAWTATDWEPADGVGPLGIRVAVTAVDGVETAYVLVDGNNMEPGLRDDLVGALCDDASAAGSDREPTPVATDGGPPLVDEAEVMTTDTHVVNTVKADNQVGTAIDDDDLRSAVTSLVAEARADAEPVTAGMATERARVTVFGNDRTETLASHANAVVSIGGALAAAVTLVAMGVSVLLFFLA